MKKKILSVALAAMALVSVNAVAQTPDNNSAAAVEQTCANPAACKKDKCSAFDGINLTETQKSQLKALRESRKAAREAKKESAKAGAQRCDSTLRASREADRRAYLEEIKGIIGPDNYVIFLENSFVQGGPKVPGFDGRKMKGDFKGKFPKGEFDKGKKALRDGKGKLRTGEAKVRGAAKQMKEAVAQ